MLKIRKLSMQLAKKAQDELNEKPSEMENHIKDLRNWILKQPYLIARTDDQFLVTFLRGSKYNQDVAKQKINLFFTMRSLSTEITQMRDIRFGKNAKLLKLGTTIPLPMPQSYDGPRIILIRPGAYNPEEFDIVDVFKMYILLTDFLLMEDDNFVVSGQVGILDLTNVTSAHFDQFKPDIVKKMTYLCQDSLPVKPMGFHYVCCPDGFEFIFNLFKSFMLFVHGQNFGTLYNHVPKQFLPTEYGGDAGTIAQLSANWMKKLLDNVDSLNEWNKYGTNELHRPGAPITDETIKLSDFRI
ncbi:retinol-binding protein pinta-like isoform X2 [Contarinia nasturtii]|uniref:retinol-binding protein pinta-like isoform X2 n=1 Tax=Contarinia nasturtii TaxID=265458 RepID=UPI0012D3DD71|nr:retinol-binding protein pinta-like isoform X2 [Contarinia nasturtii]